MKSIPEILTSAGRPTSMRGDKRTLVMRAA